MIRKTYGVSGLMDWTTQIKAGKGAVSVHFTGGALTAYGVTPAKFSTSNPFFQNVIECSDHFKNGRIKLLEQMEVPDDAATKARKARAKAAAELKLNTVSDAAPVVEAPKEPAVAPAPTDETTTTVQVEQPAETGAADEGADGGEGDADGAGDAETGTGNKITVADKSDAIEWLKEHYPEKKYTATALRTKSAFDAACNECGVEFEFTAE